MKNYLVPAVLGLLVLAGIAFFIRPAKPLTPVSEVKNLSVTSGQKVQSPLTLTGEARGNWYFEANLPVEIVDANNNSLVKVGAQAQADWMTEDFVPFTVTLNFLVPPTPTGQIIIHADNPSGDPARDKSFSIPISF